MKINRLFEIVYILLHKKTMTAKELAERFEVSTRTIYRDIETLSMAGIPVYMSAGKGGGISIMDDFVLNKALLTDSEKSDILSSLRAVNAINFNETNSAVKKLSNLFGDGNTDWIEVDFSNWYNSEKESETFSTLRSAILSKKIVTFSYASQKGEKTTRKVEPLRLCFKGMSRYLYAFCHTRQDYRFFKLSRIKDLITTQEEVERKVLGPIFQNSNVFEKEEYINLKLKLSSEIAFRVYDEFDSYTLHEDGSFIVETIYPKGEWIFSYIASFGHHCQVLEPVEISEYVQKELLKILRNYS